MDFTYADKLKVLTNEIQRIREENAILDASKEKMEGFLVQELEDLNTKLMLKGKETEEVTSRNLKLTAAQSKKREGDLNVWMARQESFRKAIV